MSYHHGDLRRALLDAAYARVEAEGGDALTLRAIAKEVGVSHAAPVRHFEGLRGLQAAVAARGFRALLQEMTLPADSLPLDRMRQVGTGYVCFALQRPHLFRFIFHPALVPFHHLEGLSAESERTFEYVVDTVSACQKAGVVRAGPPVELAQFAWSAVHGISVLAVDGQFDSLTPSQSAAELAGSITKNIFFGLKA